MPHKLIANLALAIFASIIAHPTVSQPVPASNANKQIEDNSESEFS